MAAVGCHEYLEPGEDARWDLTFRPPEETAPGNYSLGVFGAVWEGRAWSNMSLELSLQVGAAYEAAYVDHTRPWLVAPGEVGKFSVVLRNTGTATWRRDRVFLGTPADQPFPYADDSWLSPRRVALAEEEVPPGGIGHFTADIAPPPEAAAAHFDQHFALVVEGSYWFARELGLYVPVYIGDADHLPYSAADYAAEYVSHTEVDRALARGDTARVTVTLRNTGAAVLFTTGQHPVRLRASNPLDRRSGFVDTGDPLSIGAAGVRLPVDRVDPGEEFTFVLPVKVAEDMAAGTYKEYFRPVAEGLTWFGPQGIYWPFTVS